MRIDCQNGTANNTNISGKAEIIEIAEAELVINMQRERKFK